MVKNLPAMRETQAQSLNQEDPLEKGMATHSSVLTWRIPWTEEPGGLQSMELQRVRHNQVTNTFTYTYTYVKSNQHPAFIDHLVGKDLEQGGQGSKARLLPYNTHDTKQTYLL